jgi:hypothetical protein
LRRPSRPFKVKRAGRFDGEQGGGHEDYDRIERDEGEP